MKRSINKKIVMNTISIVIVLAVVLVAVMSAFMQVLTKEILTEMLPSTIKTASQSIEGNMHMLADRIFMIGDNDIFTSRDSTEDDKRSILKKAQSGIEFLWLGLYNEDGSLYLGDENCPAAIIDRTMFPMLQETQNLVVDDVSSSPEGLELTVGTPIMAGEDLLYYFVGSYKYDVLNDVLSNINLSANGKAFIVNHEGQVMGSRDTGLVDQDATIQEDTKIDGITEKVTSGETGTVIMKSSGKEYYVGYAPINGTRWYLAVIVPEADFMGPANTGILLSTVITAVLLLLAGILTLRFSSKIQRSLTSVTDRIGLLAQGDLKTPTEVIQTKDETEVLSHALSDTVDSINGYISELSDILENMSGGNFQVEVRGRFDGDFVIMKESLNKIIDSLNQMLRAIKQSSKEVLSTANIVSQGAQQVQDGSTEQSNSLSVLSDETAAIKENILEVDENTRNVEELMDTVKQSMDIGGEYTRNLLQAMEDINKNSMEITKINKFLEDISFQTNILALNASVEAARAGSAGGGFATVADEVRSLAAQSAESSQRTSNMISSSLKAVEKGTEYAEKVAESFKEIEKISQKIAEITNQLADRVNVQKQSLGNITSQIAQIKDFAEQNLSVSREEAAASQTLNRQAEKLQYMSEQFKLREE